MSRLLVLLALLIVALPAAAQDGASSSLIADRVEVSPDGVLTATGAVEIAAEGVRLTAAELVYDRGTGELEIAGPIRIEDAAGTLVLADGAALDAELRTGIARGVRVVIDAQLQIAAAELARAGPRFDTLGRAVASSCRVCAANPTPLWEIRARRVVHDRTERQIYFEGAQFRVAGLPVAYLPRLRLPGPGNDRATGVLTPSLRTTSQLGTGLSVPFFVALGPSRDLTVTPYLSGSTRTLGLRYRQAFERGTLDVEGAGTDDDIDEGGRGYLFASGRFRNARGVRLEFDVEAASDDDYLLDYGITDSDILRRELRVIDVRTNTFRALRFGEDERLRGRGTGVEPGLQVRAEWVRRVPRAVGGIAELRLLADGHRRASDDPLDGPDADTLPDGRDLARVAASADWRRAYRLPAGAELTARTRLDLQAVRVADDATFDGTLARAVPTAGATLRWPLVRRRGGATDLLEPTVQLLWSGDAADAPNDDATRPELDEGNLFALPRFPGDDVLETGARANLGLAWTRTAPGYTLGGTAGRVYRGSALEEFALGGPVPGTRSDWLLALGLSFGEAVRADARALVGDDGEVTRAETRIAARRGRLSLAAGYVWNEGQREIDGIRSTRISELAVDAGFPLGRAWDASAALRYDFAEDRAQRAGIGLTWSGDCARARLDLSRRFSDADDLSAETRFGVSVELTGIGGAARRAGGACGG